MRGLPKARYYIRLSQKVDQFVCIMRIGLDSLSRPTAESCNAANDVEENVSDSNFYCSILLHSVSVEGLALAHQKLQ